jgi:hypothetical protein
MRRGQEETSSRVSNEFPKALHHAAARGIIDRDNRKCVHSARICAKERAVGALQKANAVSLRLPDARGRHVKETRDLSQVQNETRQETG